MKYSLSTKQLDLRLLNLNIKNIHIRYEDLKHQEQSVRAGFKIGSCRLRVALFVSFLSIKVEK